MPRYEQQHRGFEGAGGIERLISDLHWGDVEGGWVRGAGPWTGAVPAGRGVVCYLAKGTCQVRGATGEPHRLSRGDVALGLNGSGLEFRGPAAEGPHGLSGVSLLATLRESPGATATGGDEARLLYVSFDSPASAAGILPELVLVPGSRGRAPGTLESVLRLLAAEVERPGGGSAVVLEHALAVLLIQALRQHGQAAASADPAEAPAVSGGADPAITAAISLMHSAPEVSWSVAGLASRVGLSRSVFALRFLEQVGQTPLAYLLELRMRLAARLLAQDEVHVKEIASRASYGSAAAFGHAFRRWSGESPGRYRARVRGDRPGLI